jgi:hypothetical protein
MDQDAIMMLLVVVIVPLLSIVALKIGGKQKRTRRPIHRYRPEP